MPRRQNVLHWPAAASLEGMTRISSQHYVAVTTDSPPLVQQSLCARPACEAESALLAGVLLVHPERAAGRRDQLLGCGRRGNRVQLGPCAVGDHPHPGHCFRRGAGAAAGRPAPGAAPLHREVHRRCLRGTHFYTK